MKDLSALIRYHELRAKEWAKVRHDCWGRAALRPLLARAARHRDAHLETVTRLKGLQDAD